MLNSISQRIEAQTLCQCEQLNDHLTDYWNDCRSAGGNPTWTDDLVRCDDDCKGGCISSVECDKNPYENGLKPKSRADLELEWENKRFSKSFYGLCQTKYV